jgi:hypothetical protein
MANSSRFLGKRETKIMTLLLQRSSKTTSAIDCCVVLTNAPLLLLNSNVPLLIGDFFLLSQTVIDKVSKAHVLRKQMNLYYNN